MKNKELIYGIRFWSMIIKISKVNAIVAMFKSGGLLVHGSNSCLAHGKRLQNKSTWITTLFISFTVITENKTKFSQNKWISISFDWSKTANWCILVDILVFDENLLQSSRKTTKSLVNLMKHESAFSQPPPPSLHLNLYKIRNPPNRNIKNLYRLTIVSTG